jgi:hypothetical protein
VTGPEGRCDRDRDRPTVTTKGRGGGRVCGCRSRGHGLSIQQNHMRYARMRRVAHGGARGGGSSQTVTTVTEGCCWWLDAAAEAVVTQSRWPGHGIRRGVIGVTGTGLPATRGVPWCKCVVRPF